MQHHINKCKKCGSSCCRLVLYRQAGWFLWPDCAPSSECPQPSITARRRLNQNIPPSVVLLQQCHCWNRHRGKLQNLSPLSVLFESRPIFLQYTGGTDAKNDRPEFWNSNSVIFENFWNFQKGVARFLCGRSGPLWSRPPRSQQAPCDQVSSKSVNVEG